MAAFSPLNAFAQPWLQIGTLASYVFVGRPYHLQSAASLPVATGEEVDVQFLVGAAPYRALRRDSEGDRPSLETRVICYGALFLMWLFFFTGVMEWL
jgi:hypothetical protein